MEIPAADFLVDWQSITSVLKLIGVPVTQLYIQGKEIFMILMLLRGKY